MIRVLGPDDAAAFHDIRLRAVREHPEAFGGTPEEVDSVEAWAKRLVKPCALKVGDTYYDEELMVLDVPRR
jgi:hypothetical protein